MKRSARDKLGHFRKWYGIRKKPNVVHGGSRGDFDSYLFPIKEGSKLGFEVASVKANKSERGSAIDSSPGRFVAKAYRVRDFQIAGGPN
jgi:hypothetical protein